MAGTTVLSGTSGLQALTPGTVQTQAGGTVVSGGVAVIAAGNAADAVTLPPAGAGQVFYLVNLANAKNLFPPLGGTLTPAATGVTGAVNAVLSIAASKAAIVVFTDNLNAVVIALA